MVCKLVVPKDLLIRCQKPSCMYMVDEPGHMDRDGLLLPGGPSGRVHPRWYNTPIIGPKWSTRNRVQLDTEMDTLNNGTNLASEVSIMVIQVPRTVFGCVL